MKTKKSALRLLLCLFLSADHVAWAGIADVLRDQPTPQGDASTRWQNGFAREDKPAASVERGAYVNGEYLRRDAGVTRDDTNMPTGQHLATGDFTAMTPKEQEALKNYVAAMPDSTTKTFLQAAIDSPIPVRVGAIFQKDSEGNLEVVKGSAKSFQGNDSFVRHVGNGTEGFKSPEAKQFANTIKAAAQRELGEAKTTPQREAADNRLKSLNGPIPEGETATAVTRLMGTGVGHIRAEVNHLAGNPDFEKGVGLLERSGVSMPKLAEAIMSRPNVVTQAITALGKSQDPQAIQNFAQIVNVASSKLGLITEPMTLINLAKDGKVGEVVAFFKGVDREALKSFNFQSMEDNKTLVGAINAVGGKEFAIRLNNTSEANMGKMISAVQAAGEGTNSQVAAIISQIPTNPIAVAPPAAEPVEGGINGLPRAEVGATRLNTNVSGEHVFMGGSKALAPQERAALQNFVNNLPDGAQKVMLGAALATPNGARVSATFQKTTDGFVAVAASSMEGFDNFTRNVNANTAGYDSMGAAALASNVMLGAKNAVTNAKGEIPLAAATKRLSDLGTRPAAETTASTQLANSMTRFPDLKAGVMAVEKGLTPDVKPLFNNAVELLQRNGANSVRLAEAISTNNPQFIRAVALAGETNDPATFAKMAQVINTAAGKMGALGDQVHFLNLVKSTPELGTFLRNTNANKVQTFLNAAGSTAASNLINTLGAGQASVLLNVMRPDSVHQMAQAIQENRMPVPTVANALVNLRPDQYQQAINNLFAAAVR